MQDALKEGFANCCVCLKKLVIYSEPMLLGCMHSVCKTCLTENKSSHNLLYCEFCKDKVDVSTTKVNLFWIREFLKSKVETNDVDNGSTVESNRVTCACCDEKLTIEAYCGTCEGPICSECVKAHKKPKELRCHDIQVKSVAKEKAFEMMSKLMQCTAHSEVRSLSDDIVYDNHPSTLQSTFVTCVDKKWRRWEKLSLFCETCSDLVCEKCIVETHQEHKVISIITESTELKEKLDMQKKEWYTQILEKRIAVDAAIDEHFRCELNVNKTEREKKMELLTFEKKFKEWIDKTSREALDQLSKKCDEKRAEYRVKHSKLKVLSDKLTHVERFITSIVDRNIGDNFLSGLLLYRGFIKTQIAELLESEVVIPLEAKKGDILVNVLDWQTIASGFNTFLKNSEEDDGFRIFKSQLLKKMMTGISEQTTQLFSKVNNSTVSVSTGNDSNDSVANETVNRRPSVNTSAHSTQPMENVNPQTPQNISTLQRTSLNTSSPKTTSISSTPKTSTPIHAMNSENLLIVRPLSENTVAKSPSPTTAQSLPHKNAFQPPPPPPPNSVISQQGTLVAPPMTGYANNCCNSFVNNPPMRPPPPSGISQLQTHLMSVPQPQNNQFNGCVVCLYESNAHMPHMKCDNCLRWFHYQCHIPQIEPQLSRENWRCILCCNLNIPGTLTTNDFSQMHKLFCSRMLLRLVSQLNSIKVRCQIRLQPPQGIEAGENHSSFEIIKCRLWNRDHRSNYKNIIQFIVDVKRALDALSQYNVSNQNAAEDLRSLEQFFQRQIMYDIPAMKEQIVDIFKNGPNPMKSVNYKRQRTE